MVLFCGFQFAEAVLSLSVYFFHMYSEPKRLFAIAISVCLCLSVSALAHEQVFFVTLLVALQFQWQLESEEELLNVDLLCKQSDPRVVVRSRWIQSSFMAV